MTTSDLPSLPTSDASDSSSFEANLATPTPTPSVATDRKAMTPLHPILRLTIAALAGLLWGLIMYPASWGITVGVALAYVAVVLTVQLQARAAGNRTILFMFSSAGGWQVIIMRLSLLLWLVPAIVVNSLPDKDRPPLAIALALILAFHYWLSMYFEESKTARPAPVEL